MAYVPEYVHMWKSYWQTKYSLTSKSKTKQDHQEVQITESSNYGEKLILQFILWTLNVVQLNPIPLNDMHL